MTKRNAPRSLRKGLAYLSPQKCEAYRSRQVKINEFFLPLNEFTCISNQATHCALVKRNHGRSMASGATRTHEAMRLRRHDIELLLCIKLFDLKLNGLAN
jgi:hypothetical protein